MVYTAIALVKKNLNSRMLHIFSAWVGLRPTAAGHEKRKPPPANKAAKKAFNDVMREAAMRTVRDAVIKSENQLRRNGVYDTALARLRMGGSADRVRPFLIVLKDEFINKVYYC